MYYFPTSPTTIGTQIMTDEGARVGSDIHVLTFGNFLTLSVK